MKIPRLSASEYEETCLVHDERQRAMRVPEHLWRLTLLTAGNPGKSGGKREQRQDPGLKRKGYRHPGVPL